MANNKQWRHTTLAEIASSGEHGFVDGPFGSNLPASSYTESGIPVIRGANLSLGTQRFNDSSFVFVSKETAERLERSCCRPFDVVFTKKGTIGQTGLVPANGRFDRYLISSNQMKLTVDQTLSDPLFVYYHVSSPASQEKIRRDSEATGVPKTNLTYLRTFPIYLPPLSEQKAIASILGSLDDKIELNRRMNETLESMARAIFKSWFVDFDPVRAKMDGRQPAGMDQATADLFPDAFETVDGELVPKGWEVATMDELVEITRGRSYKSSELSESETALVSLKSIQRGGGYRSDGLKPYTGIYKPTQVVQPGEMVVAFTDVTQAAELLGKPALVQHDKQFKNLVASLDLGIVRPTTPYLSIAYLYCLFLTEDFQSHALSYSTGTTVLHLGKKAIPDYKTQIPPSNLLRTFTQIASQNFESIQTNELQSTTLANLRDTLLPKLLSGELRVKDAEKAVSSAL